MTYIEKITYQTGSFLQIMQFAIKNAYRLTFLTNGSKVENPSLKGNSTILEVQEASAIKELVKNQSFTSKETISYFSSNEGLSKKDLNTLSKLLKKRDYIISYYFIDNASQLAMENALIYESKIKELDEYINEATNLNISISKSIEKQYKAF